jgi:hypothetical protein
MTRKQVIALVFAHAGITWAAVAFRIDQFPLTWAPMYSAKSASQSPERSTVFKDNDFLKTYGWRGTRRDGAEEWIRRADLNVPRRSMWRLYYQRTWRESPPKFKQKNAGGWTLDRWARGLPPGAKLLHADWERRLLVSVNKTLGRTPETPAFIERLSAVRTQMVFDRASLELLRREQETAELVWRDEWREDFE